MIPLPLITDAPCVGQHELFDSTSVEDHLRARALCRSCPFTQECSQTYRKLYKTAERRAGKDGVPVGTWGGLLRGTGPDGQVTARMYASWEESMFTLEEARAAHAAYARGDRSDRARIGERVYQRQRARAQRERVLA